MFRTVRRLFLPNPLDWKLKRLARRHGKKVLLVWNRGLGDIALGLYAIIERIKQFAANAEITFLTRENLKEGFSLLPNIRLIIDPMMKRSHSIDIKESFRRLRIDSQDFDLIIENPSPTDWVRWQRGLLTPRLQWDHKYEDLWKKFSLDPSVTYIGVQAVIETAYGTWRNWPLSHWKNLFARLERFSNVKVLLFGSDEKTEFKGDHLIDLRGKTNLYELLSIVKNCCDYLILPDSGILSMVYYLDEAFPIRLISLWADPNHGILKQAVASPNKELQHVPLIAKSKNLMTVSVDQVLNQIFPVKALQTCSHARDFPKSCPKKGGCILLAGGEGSRLNMLQPKGCFEVLGKSLFQWICEKAPKENFPIAVMTNPKTHDEIVLFFQKHNNFDREVFFFQQSMLPFLHEKNNQELCIQTPSGNGAVFRSFAGSFLLQEFQKREITYVSMIPIDNLLANPADGPLFNFADQAQADIAVQCIDKKQEHEKMGILVEREGNIEVMEYLEKYSKISEKYFNTAVMVMRLSFIEKMAKKELPVHFVKKRIPNTKKWGWKRESFIFDSFGFGKVVALCSERKESFCPIKDIDSLKDLF